MTDSSGYFVHRFGNTDPSWKEAMTGPYAQDWIEANLAERNSHEEHGTFTLVPRQVAKGKRVFKPKVVLKTPEILKKKEQSSIFLF